MRKCRIALILTLVGVLSVVGCHREPPPRMLLSIRFLRFALTDRQASLDFPPVAGNIDVSTLLHDIDDAEKFYRQLASLYEFKSFRFINSLDVDTLLPLREHANINVYHRENTTTKTKIDLVGIDTAKLRFLYRQVSGNSILREYEFAVRYGKSLSLATMRDSTSRNGELFVVSVSGMPVGMSTPFDSVRAFLARKNASHSIPTDENQEFRKRDQELVDAIFGDGKFVLRVLPKNLDPARTLDSTKHEDYKKIDRQPEPEGGMAALFQHFQYPQSARDDQVQGRVFLSLMVDSTGVVKQKKVIRSVRRDLDSAALAALEGVRFKPAIADGKPVSIWVTLPIEFRLK